MTNLTEVHESLSLKQKDIMVKIWNSRRSDKISVGSLPFVDAWQMKRVLHDFYDGVADDHTTHFPRGVTFKELLNNEAYIKRMVSHATR